MKQKLKPIGKADFSIIGNDMYWKFYGFDIEHKLVKLNWQGYNDQRWWQTVAESDAVKTQRAENGKLYRIDFKTNEVF